MENTNFQSAKKIAFPGYNYSLCACRPQVALPRSGAGQLISIGHD